MIIRKEETAIRNWLSDHRHALLITGARQIGKTYLIRHVLESSQRPYVEFNFIRQPELVQLFNDASGVRELLTRISVASEQKLIPGETVFFFDEVQECKELVTWIKFLVEEGSFQYILSGSLLGIELSDIRSTPVGYMKIIDMYPVDLFEFFKALGIQDQTIAMIEEHFRNRSAIDEFVHERLLRAYYLYLIIGGMPEAIQTYLDTNDIVRVSEIHHSIIRQYKMDFAKYEQKNKLRLREIYDAIPGELEEKNKRFFINHLGDKTIYDRVKNDFLWLKDAGVALPVYNVTEPKAPLRISEKRNLFKLFLSDVGLLTSLYPNEVKMQILQRNESINNGGLFENAVVQELTAKGFPVYYFNSKRQGELDAIIEWEGRVLPIEVKSGKSYTRHSALDNCIGDANYEIEEAFVLCNGNIRQEGKVTYLPIYMAACIKKEMQDKLIYKLDLGGI